MKAIGGDELELGPRSAVSSGVARAAVLFAPALPIVALPYSLFVLRRVPLVIYVDFFFFELYLTIGALALLGAGAAGLALALLRRGKRVASAPVALLAGAPWLAGNTLARIVSAHGDPHSVAGVVTPITSVLLTFLGSVSSAAVLASFGLGLALTLAAEDGRDRGRGGVIVGASIGIVLCALPVASALASDLRHSSFSIWVAALAAATFALAGSSAGTGSRTNALAASAGCAAALSVVAAAHAVEASVWIDAYYSILGRHEENPYPHFCSILSDASALIRFAELAWLPASVAASAFGAWALARSRGAALRILAAPTMVIAFAALVFGSAGPLVTARELVDAMWGPDRE
jgi:hypothetical protein